MFGQNRDELRQMYADAWNKRCAGKPMSPLEVQIADVVESHPEYHGDMTGEGLTRDFGPEGGRTNPFLHMGLHLGIREQVATNRPTGIARIYESLAKRMGDAHAAEHEMIECLAEVLWEAQRDNRPPDEARYLENLRQLAGRKR
ncbi:MAG: DUF1841 family protein [Woeseiaceae bacterium]|nr:DUF1841 family protein [Woeseiaceae bacterium]